MIRKKQVYRCARGGAGWIDRPLYGNTKPLVTVEDVVSNDSSVAPMPVINLRHVQLKNIDVDYRNSVSALFTQAKFNDLTTRVNTADLNGRRIILDQIRLLGADAKVLMGKTESAKLVVEKAKTEAKDIAAQELVATNARCERS